METEIFPVHGEPGCDYSIMDMPCMVASLALALASFLLRKKRIQYVLDPEGCMDGVRTLTHGAIDELKASLAVALVGARCVSALSPQALNSRVLTLIHICQEEGHSTE